MLDWEEYSRWLESAEKTLESAKRETDNNWSCFKAEQSAQLAIKGLLILLGKNYFGHDILTLIKKTEINIEKNILECAIYLGRLYIPTRYPDALPGSTPYAYYTEEDKRKAIECSEKILSWVKNIGENLKRKEKTKKQHN